MAPSAVTVAVKPVAPTQTCHWNMRELSSKRNLEAYIIDYFCIGCRLLLSFNESFVPRTGTNGCRLQPWSLTDTHLEVRVSEMVKARICRPVHVSSAVQVGISLFINDIMTMMTGLLNHESVCHLASFCSILFTHWYCSHDMWALPKPT